MFNKVLTYLLTYLEELISFWKSSATGSQRSAENWTRVYLLLRWPRSVTQVNFSDE